MEQKLRDAIRGARGVAVELGPDGLRAAGTLASDIAPLLKPAAAKLAAAATHAAGYVADRYSAWKSYVPPEPPGRAEERRLAQLRAAEANIASRPPVDHAATRRAVNVTIQTRGSPAHDFVLNVVAFESAHSAQLYTTAGAIELAAQIKSGSSFTTGGAGGGAFFVFYADAPTRRYDSFESLVPIRPGATLVLRDGLPSDWDAKPASKYACLSCRRSKSHKTGGSRRRKGPKRTSRK